MTVIDSDGFLALALTLAPSKQINSIVELTALLIHAVNAKHGALLDGRDEDALAPLAEDWTAGAPSQPIRFKYDSDESGDSICTIEADGDDAVKVTLEGDKIEDEGEGKGNAATFEFEINDYFDRYKLPFTPPPLATAISEQSPLLTLFSAPACVNEFFADYKEQIGFYFIPGTPSLSNEDLGPDSRENSPPAAPATKAPRGPELKTGGGKIGYPDTGGPMGIIPGAGGIPLPGTGGGRNPFGFGTVPQPDSQRSPFNVGGSDLDPLGGRPAAFPGFPGSSGPSFGGRGGDGGGMFMGPGHPLFQGGGGVGGRGGGPAGGLWGGDGFLPRGSVPPGARFDPVGPMNEPPGGGVGGVGGPQQGRGRGGGGPLGLGSRDPDWNGQPPSRNSDYDNMFS